MIQDPVQRNFFRKTTRKFCLNPPIYFQLLLTLLIIFKKMQIHKKHIHPKRRFLKIKYVSKGQNEEAECGRGFAEMCFRCLPLTSNKLVTKKMDTRKLMYLILISAKGHHPLKYHLSISINFEFILKFHGCLHFRKDHFLFFWIKVSVLCDPIWRKKQTIFKLMGQGPTSFSGKKFSFHNLLYLIK